MPSSFILGTTYITLKGRKVKRNIKLFTNMLIENIDKLNEIVYNIGDEIYLEANMSISEQIKVLCVRSNISMAELARRIGLSPQSFSAKMKRESFTIAELNVIADAVGASFVRKFVLYNGDEI